MPLVADMSSDILSRPLDISRFGMIYAGAQKNIGPSGIVVVIIREDLLGRARSLCPTMLDYKVAADNGSMYNTPPTLAWYLSGLVFEWLKEQGGVEAIGKRNEIKQRTLYDFIDASELYSNPINKPDRSWMNVRSAWLTIVSTSRSWPVPMQTACLTSRAIARWEACVHPSTTRSISTLSTRWWPT